MTDNTVEIDSDVLYELKESAERELMVSEGMTPQMEDALADAVDQAEEALD